MFRSLVIVPFAALAACASPTPPSVSATDIAAADAERQRISLLPDVAGTDLPTSSVDYSGNFLSNNLMIDGEGGYGVLGDLAMTIDFGGSNRVSGSVRNLNLTERGAPDQLLGGRLDIRGSSSGGDIVARASGELDAVSDLLPFRGTTNVEFAMTGGTRQDGNDTAVFGTWVGASTSVDDDFFVTGSGTFFGTED